MTGKHVRFSTENTFHPPPPPLPPLPPLPPFSSSSHSSTSSPTTSPIQQHAPRRPRSSTHSAPARARAHKLLAHTAAPILVYDLAQHPSTMTLSLTTPRPGLGRVALLEPAVSPPQPAITIVSPHLPWALTVAASSSSAHGYVTVADLLGALHRALRAGITPTEFHALGTRALMRRVAGAYEARCRRGRGSGSRNGSGYGSGYEAEEERRGGVRRVDFLMGCTAFRGLSRTARAGVWHLHVA
ncbi:hypothetical protein B0H15DRAFT_910811 [Mycena belliarum]|uniref:DUF6699 domain-containing protein n=1 Tax=Mycena belliarum TaxID=1033014 RepID=A0AAD6U4H4_9AGAR|nr:hypothetical protein B0H15DRAFT_910811 [Mycena belliae]